MISAIPLQNAILMGGYGVGQQYYDGPPQEERQNSTTSRQQQRLWAIFVGGCTGGVLQSFLMSPVELIKVLRQCQPTSSSSSSSSSSSYLGSSTSSAWRRGLSATLLRDGIPHGVWFVSYEATKNYIVATTSGDDESNQTVMAPLVSGAVAATVAWAVGYPADVIKTRQQAAAGCRSTTALGVVATGRLLVQEAGGNVMQGLYRGFGLKLVRAVPASMIGFSVYELVKKQLVVA